MLDFSEEQKFAQQAIRSWCAQNLEPRVLAMEAGELSVYPTMRELGAAFGIPDMARASFEKMRRGRSEGASSRESMAGADMGLMAVLMIELSRVCPGFAMAFGASMGLFAGAVMAKGTPEQKERWA